MATLLLSRAKFSAFCHGHVCVFHGQNFVFFHGHFRKYTGTILASVTGISKIVKGKNTDLVIEVSTRGLGRNHDLFSKAHELW